MHAVGSLSATAVFLLAAIPALGQDAPPAPTSAPAAQDAEPANTEAVPNVAEGLLPLQDYTGDLLTRRYLTGDWGGHRTALAKMGIQLDVNYTNILQSVLDGGRDTDTRYGGTLDYNLNLDLHRMGVMPGAIIKFRAESRYGGSVNGIAGPILPVNTDALFPMTAELDDDIPITITNLLYMQFLSEKFGLLLGKFDTLDSDPNEFSSGRGMSQFLNSNFVFNATSALTAPYSTLGAGAILIPVKGITLSTSIYNTADSSTTTGFEDFGDGASWATEAQFQYRLGQLPGGQNVGFIYSFDNNFNKIGGRFTLQRGEGVVAPSTDNTWSVYWSGWQYLYVENPSDAQIDVTNGTVDRQGVGLFARFGLADHDVNPVEWSASGGIGGRGVIPSRDDDTFGVGYYYSKIETGRLGAAIGLDDETQGFEAFYNLSITPAAHLTIDVQVVDSLQPSIDDAVVVGLRLGLRF